MRIGNTFVRHIALPAALLSGLAIAGFFTLHRETVLAQALLRLTLFFGSLPLVWNILASFVRRRFGIDVIAVVAVIGSAALSHYAVGIVILLMLATGETLEHFAFQRARKEITELLARVPTQARKKINAAVVDIPVGDISPGDILLIRPGEVIPVDGVILEGVTFVDESALTGEALPVEKKPSMRVMSGSVNQSGSIDIRVTAASADSQYERIIRLVRKAQADEAPFVRMADRYSARFTLLTFSFAVLTWLFSHDSTRVLAVLVVATPCPLILATPIAFASGMSRAAKRGIMIKNGGALEQLGNARSFVFDKTGTLTLGTPRMRFIDAHGLSPEKILAVVASLEQCSDHIMAHAIAEYVRSHPVKLSLPRDFKETLGKGVSGTIDGARYHFGSLSFIETCGIAVNDAILLKHETSKDLGVMIVYLATSKGIVGDIHFADIVRPEIPFLFRSLLASGIERIVMLTGDKEYVAAHIASRAGIAEYRSECLPEDKITEIEKLKKTHAPVIMVGDGVNDAPALVAADMGIALGTRGSNAASEASDIVITVNTLERIVEAFALGKKVLAVSKQGILIGIGASVVLMIFASFGFISPLLGAVLQEAIDVVAIANALRVHWGRSYASALPNAFPKDE
jgi:heavy metal translocating P-type ATPase